MTSSDVEIFRSGLEDLKYYIDGRISEVKAEIRTVNENVLVNSARIESQRDFMSIGFTIMAVVIALVGFVITLAPMFREMYRDARQAKRESALTRSEVEEMISDAISRTLKN